MSLFEKCEVYLNNYNIELQDSDYTPDGRLQIDNNNEISKWDFPNIPQPTKEDLDKIDNKDIEKLRKKTDKKQKLKTIKKSFQFPILNDEDIINLQPYDGLIYINEKDGSLYYYYKNKLQKVRLE